MVKQKLPKTASIGGDSPDIGIASSYRRLRALGGLVERVTFQNPDNGFCVLRVKTWGQRDLVTVVGHAPTISAGEFVQATGTWINDRTHEPQFKASSSGRHRPRRSRESRGTSVPA